LIGEPSKAIEVDDADRGFAEFWKHYPRKVARPAARRAYAVALKKADAAEILAGAMRYAAERDGQDAKYTKHPATWLNNECWTDEPSPGVRAGRSSRPAHAQNRSAALAAEELCRKLNGVAGDDHDA
jgi:hypothetical protein